MAESRPKAMRGEQQLQLDEDGITACDIIP